MIRPLGEHKPAHHTPCHSGPPVSGVMGGSITQDKLLWDREVPCPGPFISSYSSPPVLPLLAITTSAPHHIQDTGHTGHREHRSKETHDTGNT